MTTSVDLRTITGRVLLVGTDYEGDTREDNAFGVKDALILAYECSRNEDGYGWLRWELWGNDPAQDGRWCCVATSE